jgi:hypothetical protein
MATCEKLEKCPFFHDKLADMPAVSDLMKKEYCLGDKTRCARFLVSTAGLPVPADLFPSEYTRAVQLCESRIRK